VFVQEDFFVNIMDGILATTLIVRVKKFSKQNKMVGLVFSGMFCGKPETKRSMKDLRHEIKSIKKSLLTT
jgi:hypothetical protein